MPYSEKTAEQVVDQISAILETFSQCAALGVHRQARKINDVAFVEHLVIFKSLSRTWGERVRLFVNGELGTEGMLIVFEPAIGQSILIESVPCVSVAWKIKDLEINVN